MLGTNIREYRKNKKLTIKELSERTGLSIGYISQVEREEAEPSLSSLRKIAREFDVPVYVLMDDHKNAHNLTIRREERLSVRIKKSSVEYEFLTPLPSPNFSPKTLMIKAILEPCSRDTEIPIVHHSEETLLVLKGTLTVVAGDVTIVVTTGSAALLLKKRSVGLTLVQFRADNLNCMTTTGRRRFQFDESHYFTSAKLIS